MLFATDQSICVAPHVQVDPSGWLLALLTSKQMFPHSIDSFNHDVTFNLMSTKASHQPDGSPCTYMYLFHVRASCDARVRVQVCRSHLWRERTEWKPKGYLRISSYFTELGQICPPQFARGRSGSSYGTIRCGISEPSACLIVPSCRSVVGQQTSFY